MSSLEPIAVEIVLVVLSALPELHVNDSMEEFLALRSTLNCVFHHRLFDVSSLWSRLLITTDTPLSELAAWLRAAKHWPLTVLIRVPSRRTADDVSVEHFRELLRIFVPHFSRCVDLRLEFDDIALLEVALADIAFADPATLRVMTVLIASHDFRHFVPTSLGSFQFWRRQPPFGVPFIPFSRLTIRLADVRQPSFSHLTSGFDNSLVELPSTFTIDWPDVVRLLAHSTELRLLVIDAVPFNYIPGSIVAAPPVLLHTLDLTFRGVSSMADMLVHVPLPVIHTLRVLLTVDADLACLARCSVILATISKLVLSGHHPVSRFGHDNSHNLFRLLSNLRDLDLDGAHVDFFSSFRRASLRRCEVGVPNFNACPLLGVLSVRGVTLNALCRLLLDREQSTYADIATINVRFDGPQSPYILAWFQSRGVTLLFA
ncbi:hypothetical protein C8J57DRAFT_1527034 [Mycena rebaudengoi]|nr:hypothetical protein C8J57DRAFT_1527034 [Mycena rebaudengoi]